MNIFHSLSLHIDLYFIQFNLKKIENKLIKIEKKKKYPSLNKNSDLKKEK